MIRLRAPILASLLVLLCACGATRTYDGPQRPPEEIARVRGQQKGGDPILQGIFGDAISGYYPWERLDAEVEAVDGRDIDSMGNLVELLPGEHELRLSAEDPKRMVSLGGVVRLEFAAGKEYEVTVVQGEKVERIFAVTEKGSSTVLAHSERAPEEYSPMEPADWLAEYEIADAIDGGRSVGVTWVPRGRQLSDSPELIEVSRGRSTEATTVYPGNPAWRERWQEETPKGYRQRTLRAYGKDWIAYSYSGTHPPRTEERHGLGVVRQRGDTQYRLCFERFGAPLADGELELWQQRLLDAPLR